MIKHNRNNNIGFVVYMLISCSLLFGIATAADVKAAVQNNQKSNTINPDNFSVNFVETPIRQVFEMFSKLGKVSILLSKDVSGDVTANIYQTNIEKAIKVVAAINGYSVEKNGHTYIIMPHDEVGKDTLTDGTQIKTFKVQYINVDIAAELLTKYLSRHGSITVIKERNMLVIEDDRSFINKAKNILAQVDLRPRQILIEAQILEITLQDDETFGIDWTSRSNPAVLSTNGLSTIGSTGFALGYLSKDLDVSLRALSEKGRVKTLSTPKLMVLEDQEAEVVIGDRLGFKVTTTINAVTSESVEFVESGVILKVRAEVDNQDRIMLDIHPEVSSGNIADGIPSLTTTEVTTQMIAESGQAIFIGGLIKNKTGNKRIGVPGLSKIPILGHLFSRTEDTSINTETIVIIKPYLVGDFSEGIHGEAIRRQQKLSGKLMGVNTISPAPARRTHKSQKVEAASKNSKKIKYSTITKTYQHNNR